MDGLLQVGLSSLIWFPSWLAGVKSLISFLRNQLSMGEFVKHLRRQGLLGLADALEDASFMNFAEWRWNTLHSVCKSLQPILASFSQFFDGHIFAGQRDRASLNRMIAAIRSHAWQARFKYVAWFSQWLGHMMQWAGGCNCHGELLLEGEQQACCMKGRRLPQAFDYGMSCLRAGLNEANSWDLHRWGIPGDLPGMQGAVRASFLLGSRKLAFLNELPYLICRVDKPGIAARVQELWAAHPAHSHHRVTQRFIHLYGADLALVNEDGSGVSARLEAELQHWRGMPIDDSVAEQPHSQARRVSLHSRRSGFCWVAASTRLQQNLNDLRSLPPNLDISLDEAWHLWKSVLQTEQARRVRGERNMKLSVKAFCAKVYHFSWFDEPLDAPENDAHPGGRNGGDDDDGGSDGGSARDTDDESASGGDNDDGGGGGGGDDSNDSDGGSSGGGHPPGIAAMCWRRDDEEIRLMRQYLTAALVPFMYFSLFSDSEGENSLQVFQLLALENKPVLVSCYEDDRVNEEFLFNISVQPLQIWGLPPMVESERLENVTQIDVFPFDDPILIDALSLMGSNVLDRARWRKWTPCPSSIEG